MHAAAGFEARNIIALLDASADGGKTIDLMPEEKPSRV